MMGHNTAIRMAQKLLRARAERFQDQEVAYNQWAEHPSKRAFRQAAEELEVLIIPEEDYETV